MTITIHNYMFMGTFSMAPGQTIMVKNDDTVPHTLTSTQGKFDTGQINPGQTASFVAPRVAGHYPFQCSFHSYMTGTLTVT